MHQIGSDLESRSAGKEWKSTITRLRARANNRRASCQGLTVGHKLALVFSLAIVRWVVREPVCRLALAPGRQTVRVPICLVVQANERMSGRTSERMGESHFPPWLVRRCRHAVRAHCF